MEIWGDRNAAGEMLAHRLADPNLSDLDPPPRRVSGFDQFARLETPITVFQMASKAIRVNVVVAGYL